MCVIITGKPVHVRGLVRTGWHPRPLKFRHGGPQRFVADGKMRGTSKSGFIKFGGFAIVVQWKITGPDLRVKKLRGYAFV